MRPPAKSSMRLLVVNDDGPPSKVSPYFGPFVDALRSAGHSVTVVIPDTPLSWIGKAHAVGKTLTATRVCPNSWSGQGLGTGSLHQPCSPKCSPDHGWLLLDGSPASCTQIGLFHCGYSPDDFDLVVSGPNHGPNASTIYNLSSGTVGGALEGALCGKRSIALSFGSKDPQSIDKIESACRRAVTLIEGLQQQWQPGVELYNLNVPMVSDVESRHVVYTKPSGAYWTKGSLFRELGDPNDGRMPTSFCNGQVGVFTYQFQWSPEFSDIKRCKDRSSEGDDLWAVKNGFISVTGLRANFEVVDPPVKPSIFDSTCSSPNRSRP